MAAKDPLTAAIVGLGEVAGLDAGQSGLLLIFLSLVGMGLAFHGRADWMRWLAVPGWVGVGLYFFMSAGHYIEIEDPILVFMTAAALPVCIAYAIWEGILLRQDRQIPSITWLRGAVFWSAMPYLAVQHVPLLNAAVVWFTAWNTSLMLQWSGAGDIVLGPMMVDLGTTEVALSTWEGSRWLLTDTLGEGGFFVPMVDQSTGAEINIGFVLGCSALQSMIVFVGALVAVRESPWRSRMRMMALVIPLIHILNVFRNAGIIWMHVTYRGRFDFFGIHIFDFAHAYAAKVLSLSAMYLMALMLFSQLPALHRHVVDVLAPMLRLFGVKTTA